MSDFIDWLGIVAVSVGPLWLIFHYVTKWKQAPKITQQDEKLLDELYTLARRLEDRVNTVERIVAADDPEFRNRLASNTTTDWSRPPVAQPTYSIDRRN